MVRRANERFLEDSQDRSLEPRLVSQWLEPGFPRGSSTLDDIGFTELEVAQLPSTALRAEIKLMLPMHAEVLWTPSTQRFIHERLTNRFPVTHLLSDRILVRFAIGSQNLDEDPRVPVFASQLAELFGRPAEDVSVSTRSLDPADFARPILREVLASR